MSDIRLRLAPSPTGFLHLGNLRTALFGYLLAKAQGGKFILRIEDTDQKREVPGAVDSLIYILEWIGIKFDEGPHLGGDYGPYVQSERLDLYAKQTEQLLADGQAYRCFCTAERLENMRAEQTKKKQAPRYDQTCRHLTETEVQNNLQAGLPFVIRQKMPSEGEVVVHDELRGDIRFQARDLEDHVLVKSNGVPTYQLANVIDDHFMEISQVTRGEEWIPSAPKNVLLYQAFGWPVPKFIHLPLLLNKGGGKLSKRQGDVFVEDFKEQGYLPEALINFCALLGWHPKNDQEIFSLEELKTEFSLGGLGASPAVFDLEKLDYYNGYYIRQLSLARLTELAWPYLQPLLEQASEQQRQPGYCQAVIKLAQDRLKKLSDLPELSKFFFQPDLAYASELLIWKKSNFEQTKENLQKTLEQLDKLAAENWTQGSLEEAMMTYIKSQEAGVGDFLWPLRVALTGEKNSPGPFEVAEILGPEISKARIAKAISLL